MTARWVRSRSWRRRCRSGTPGGRGSRSWSSAWSSACGDGGGGGGVRAAAAGGRRWASLAGVVCGFVAAVLVRVVAGAAGAVVVVDRDRRRGGAGAGGPSRWPGRRARGWPLAVVLLAAGLCVAGRVRCAGSCRRGRGAWWSGTGCGCASPGSCAVRRSPVRVRGRCRWCCGHGRRRRVSGCGCGCGPVWSWRTWTARPVRSRWRCSAKQVRVVSASERYAALIRVDVARRDPLCGPGRVAAGAADPEPAHHQEGGGAGVPGGAAGRPGPGRHRRACPGTARRSPMTCRVRVPEVLSNAITEKE